MTPQDFLESVTEEEPRPRIGRLKLTDSDIRHLTKHTPSRRHGGTSLFRTIHNKGIISYTEYLFLLCVLTKPQSGFRIAFNMFDTDGNQRVDKNEFLVVVNLMVKKLSEWKAVKKVTLGSRDVEKDLKQLEREANMPRSNTLAGSPKLENIFSKSRSEHPGEKSQTDTTILLHLFGKEGREVLRYEDFHRFMDNLQSEVLEIEFTEFSHGMQTISEADFAKILLRYTKVRATDQEDYIERLRKRIPEEKGITFKDFKQFCQFLNNLDDFAIAMRLYTYANHPVTQAEFQRSVKISTGYMLSDHIVDTVFQIFDVDGDGKLHHKEFISIMTDRLHRGFRSKMEKHEGWDAFKQCVKAEMRDA